MSDRLPEWLPDIIPFSDFDSDLDKYLDHLYKIFEKDFVNSKPTYQNKPVYYDSRIFNNYPMCFWHIITEDKTNDYSRIEVENLSLLRCERMPWIRPVIENCAKDEVSVWQNKRGKKKNTIFFLEEHDYVVVLNEKNRFYLVTAYHVHYTNRKRQLIQERDDYLETQKPPQGGTV